MGITTEHRHLALALFLLVPLALAAGAPVPADGEEAARAPVADASAVAPGLEIVVNIPAGELAVFEGDDFVRIYPVTVGKRSHQTPVGEYTLTKAVWNPWWHPPKSPWARGRKAQAPGPNNAMGRAKLYFKPLYFIHGTAETEVLGQPASHGCVRMSNEDVMALSRLVHQHATPDLDRAVLDALQANPKETKEIPLERPVTLRIVYERVELQGDQVVVHPDVYRRVSKKELAAQVTAALAARGTAVDEAEVARLVAPLHREGGTIPLGQLVVVDAGVAGAARAAGER
jgi:hypothetical protein